MISYRKNTGCWESSYQEKNDETDLRDDQPSFPLFDQGGNWGLEKLNFRITELFSENETRIYVSKFKFYTLFIAMYSLESDWLYFPPKQWWSNHELQDSWLKLEMFSLGTELISNLIA